MCLLPFVPLYIRDSLDKSRFRTVTFRKSTTLHVAADSREDSRYEIDVIIERISALGWKSRTLLYHFVLVFRSKGCSQNLQTFCVIRNRNYSCGKIPVTCSQRNCQPTFRYGLASFGHSCLVAVVVHVVVCNYLSYFWRRWIPSENRQSLNFILTMCRVTQHQQRVIVLRQDRK